MDPRANKKFKGTLTLLAMEKSMLLVCSKKKLFPVAATKLQPRKLVQIGIKVKGALLPSLVQLCKDAQEVLVLFVLLD